MKKLASLVLVTLAVFFMVGCGTKEIKETDVLPAIELVGDTIMEVEQYSVFVDPGVGILGEFDLEAVVLLFRVWNAGTISAFFGMSLFSFVRLFSLQERFDN